MSLASKLLLNNRTVNVTNVFHNKNYYNKNNKIHNQSYIRLNSEYTNLKKEYKNELNNQNDLILKLKKDNNKLLENNHDLRNQLLNKDRFKFIFI